MPITTRSPRTTIPLPPSARSCARADDATTDERAGRRLARVIQRKGAFRRFRDELREEYPDLLPAWYAFRDARGRRRAARWPGGNSLTEDQAAELFLTGHADPDDVFSTTFT